MIERIEFEDWDGIAAGALHPLSSRTVLVCSDERGRGAIRGALGFFRIEEQFADVYEEIWRRSRPIGAAILASLILLAPDLSTVDGTFPGLRDDERVQWTVLRLALDKGVLRCA